MYRTSYILFITTLIFAPLAFGSVEQWSMATVQLLICSSTLFLLLSLRHAKKHLLMAPGTLPLVLLVLWMFFQVLPLPSSIVQILAPSIYDIYQPIIGITPRDQWIPLTVNQRATLFECLRIASYALFYILTVQILSSGTHLKKTVQIISYLAIGIAFLAIIQKFSSPDKIYWFRSTPENAGTIGPWVYHNHYAGFMELTCPLVFALFLFYRPTINHEKSLRSRIVDACTMPGSNLHIFLGVGVIIILSSVAISLSRGGIISLTLALLVFMLILPKRLFTLSFSSALLFISSIALMTAWLGWGSIFGKFGSTFTETGTISNIRFILWQDSLRLIPDFLITGSGFGTFLDIYPLYKTTATDLILDHAHNDYIELLTDGGIIAFVLTGWFVLTILIHGWKKLHYRRDRYAILLSIGSLTAILSILFHSFTDFNMHNGANGLYFFFLCGLLVSAGNTRLFYRTKPTLLPGSGPNSNALVLIACLLTGGATIFISGGAIAARITYSEIANIYLNKKLRHDKILAVASSARRASQYDPLEGKYIFALGNTNIFLRKPDKALTLFINAAEKQPLSGIYLQRLALMLTPVDKQKAEQLMLAAYARALNKAPLILTWADWLLSLDERDKAILMLKNVFHDKPTFVKMFMPSLTAHAFTHQEIAELLPDSVTAWIAYGSLVEKLGNTDDAEFYRSGALDFLNQEEEIRPWFFTQLYWFYKRQKNHEQALMVLRQAIDSLPDHAKFHVFLGDYYRKEGIPYRATEEYKQALLLEPADEKTRKKLQKLQKN